MKIAQTVLQRISNHGFHILVFAPQKKYKSISKCKKQCNKGYHRVYRVIIRIKQYGFKK